MTSDELKIIVNRSPPTNCDLDPVPTRLLKEQFDCIIPLMVEIVNKSLYSAVFPDCLKQVIIIKEDITGKMCTPIIDPFQILQSCRK